jgi:hypothetical protein
MEPGLRVFRVVRPLELLGRQVAQGGVETDAVVERLEVLEEARRRLRPVMTMLEQMYLPRTPPHPAWRFSAPTAMSAFGPAPQPSS